MRQAAKGLGERAEYTKELRGKVWKEEGRRKKTKAQLETKGAELEGARVDRAAARAKVTHIKVEYSKSREVSFMEVSCL